jgi:hypothetical protein
MRNSEIIITDNKISKTIIKSVIESVLRLAYNKSDSIKIKIKNENKIW